MGSMRPWDQGCSRPGLSTTPTAQPAKALGAFVASPCSQGALAWCKALCCWKQVAPFRQGGMQRAGSPHFLSHRRGRPRCPWGSGPGLSTCVTAWLCQVLGLPSSGLGLANREGSPSIWEIFQPGKGTYFCTCNPYSSSPGNSQWWIQGAISCHLPPTHSTGTWAGWQWAPLLLQGFQKHAQTLQPSGPGQVSPGNRSCLWLERLGWG